jgi:hypothetical protein
MRQFTVTLHDHRILDAVSVTVETAESITRASDPVWAAIPKSERHHFSTSVEPVYASSHLPSER